MVLVHDGVTLTAPDHRAVHREREGPGDHKAAKER
jgi:hypothetical protein